MVVGVDQHDQDSRCNMRNKRSRLEEHHHSKHDDSEQTLCLLQRPLRNSWNAGVAI